MKVILGMFFLTLSNAGLQFAEKEPTWKIYTTEKALPTTHWVKLIDQKKFAKAVLDKNIEVFVVHINSLKSKMTIHLARKTQIALLLAKKVTVPVKYLDFANVFSTESANILLEQTGGNKHAIKLEKGKQLPYGPIYSVGPAELNTLKTYIKSNLANGFIKASK